jgi:single-strand DNA-binding protein
VTTTTPTAGYVGNLASDPELRFSNAGTPWMRARLSVQPYVAGADVQPEPVFLDLVCFGSLAEHVCECCHKGSRLVVAGRLEDSSWTGNDGAEHPGQKIIADAIGPDLRFTTAEINRTRRSEPATPRPDTTIAGLVGPTPATHYSDMPF